MPISIEQLTELIQSLLIALRSISECPHCNACSTLSKTAISMHSTVLGLDTV